MKLLFTTGRLARFCLFTSTLSIVFPLHADTEELSLPSVFTLSTGYDSDDGSDYYFDANVGLFDGQRLIFSAGKINLADDNDLNDGLEPYNFLIGATSSESVSFPISMEFEYWGEDGEFTVYSLRGSFGYSGKIVSVGIKPQMREFKIDVANEFPRAQVGEVDFSSKGYTLTISFSGIENTNLSFSFADNDYSEFTLALLARLQRITAKAALIRYKLINSVGLEDKIYNASASYYFDWGEIGAYWLRSNNAINEDTVTKAYGANIGINLFDDWLVDLQGGTQSSTDTENDSDFYYGTVSLSYFY